MPDPLIKIRNLSIAFLAKGGYRRVVSEVNFDIPAASCVGLVGESGSGKTLTALSLMQLLPMAASVLDSSEIWFSGVDLLQQTEHQMRSYRGLQIGMIFQDAMAAFNPVLTVGEQIDEILRKKKISKKQRFQQALNFLDRVGIRAVKRCYASYPHQLSGGMRQRAMIAMALAGEPKLIIADEPTTALDVTLQAQILALLQDLREKEKLALLFITHDLSVISQIADSIIVMQKGVVVENSRAASFFTAPQHPYSQQLLEAVSYKIRHQEPLVAAPMLVQVQDLKVYFSVKASRWWPRAEIVKAVDGVSFSIQKGRTLALVGESGSGKSTIARAMIRLLKPTSGEILFNHQDVWQISRASLQKIRKDIQIIFQDPYASLNPRRMIADSIAEGLVAQKIGGSKAEQQARVDELLLQVGLSPSMKWRYPHEFSGGERQRICIARAIALQPELLILDEPTSALDVSMQKQVLEILDTLQQRYKMTYLLITHDLAVVAYLSHNVVVVNQGCLVEQGETARVLTNPEEDYTKQLLSALPQHFFNK